jgi:hypothetical protein
MGLQHRRTIRLLVTLSLAPGVSITAAKRELRTRNNDACCYMHFLEEVRVQRIEPATARRLRGGLW